MATRKMKVAKKAGKKSSMKKGGAYHKAKTIKRRPTVLRAPLFGRNEPILTKENVESMFQMEREAPEENMFAPDFTDNVISKFKEFLDDLEEKEEDAVEEEDEEARSDIEIMKLSIALRLIDAFGSKAKNAPKTQAINAFDDDLSSLLTKMKL